MTFHLGNGRRSLHASDVKCVDPMVVVSLARTLAESAFVLRFAFIKHLSIHPFGLPKSSQFVSKL